MKCMTCDAEALPDSDSCSACEHKEFSKIGGLLWFPAFGLVAGLIMYVISITNTANVIGLIRQNAPQLTSLIIYELVAQIVLALLTLYTVILFFKRSKKTRLFYIGLLLLILAYRISDTLLAANYFGLHSHESSLSQITPAMIGALIWIPYFLKSVRVKRTFVK